MVVALIPFNPDRLKSSRPRLLLIVLFLSGVTQLVNVLSWILHISNQDGTVDATAVRVYIIVAGVGFLVFISISGPLIYWPYAHGSEMSPQARRNAFCLGLIVSFLVHDFPVGWMEIWVVWQYGWLSVLQGMSLILTMLCFAIGFFTTWIAYTWKMSKFMQIRFGDAAPSLPPASAAAVARVTSEKI